MSDELNVWREASRVHHNCPFGDCDAPDELAAAVIRSYGDQREADAYERGKLEGARLAIEAAADRLIHAPPHLSMSEYADNIRAISPVKIVGEG